MATLGMLIGGHLAAGADTFPVVNPATERIAGEAPACSPDQLGQAIEAADAALRFAWSLPDDERCKILVECSHAIQACAQDIARLLTQEQGKPFASALGEVELSARWFQETARLDLPTELVEDSQQARVEVRRRPVGVVGAITPWNYPIILAVCKVAPALRAGNSVVLKPSPFTPLATLALGEALAEVLPPGALNIVTGGDALGARLVRDPRVKKVSFTGSIEAGRSVAVSTAPRFARLTLEMGGNDAAIVLDDAEPDAVATRLFWGAFENSGQFCSAIKRLYVHRRLHEDVVAIMRDIASTVHVGDGMDPETELGPVTTEPQFQRVRTLLAEAEASGGRFVTGGASLDREGYFYPPTLVTGLDNGSRLVDEEQFGPVLPIIPFDDVDEAIAKANDTDYGLGGSVWSADLSRGEVVASRLECGTVWINQHGSLRADAPFGGLKSSGIGVEYGPWGLLEFVDIQVLNAVR